MSIRVRSTRLDLRNAAYLGELDISQATKRRSFCLCGRHQPGSPRHQSPHGAKASGPVGQLAGLDIDCEGAAAQDGRHLESGRMRCLMVEYHEEGAGMAESIQRLPCHLLSRPVGSGCSISRRFSNELRVSHDPTSESRQAAGEIKEEKNNPICRAGDPW